VSLGLPLADRDAMAAALLHLERLSQCWMPQVIAEGITEPGAALARMVELDNARIAQALEELGDLDRETFSSSVPGVISGRGARRALAMIDYVSTSVHQQVNEATNIVNTRTL
jgi:hypothetical protein